MLAVLLSDENVSAEWAIKNSKLRLRRAFEKGIITDFTKELTSPASVVINVDRRSAAMRADDIWRGNITFAWLDWFKLLTGMNSKVIEKDFVIIGSFNFRLY